MSTPTTSRRSLLGLLFGYWPWSKEVVERGSDRWSSVTTCNDMPIESTRRQYDRVYVVYRIINRYTGSVTLRKDYLD